MPEFLLGKQSIKVFNELYYRKHVSPVQKGFVSHEPFFYPLDVVKDWNRAYGPRGFTQFQCVLPKAAGADAVQDVLGEVTKHGSASFLAVIKDFGKDSQGLLSFPMPGVTLALDIPMRSDTQTVIDALNEKVIEYGGRIYLAKDSLTRRAHFEAMEGERVARFNAVRDHWDPERRYKSLQSMRLFGD